MANSKIVLADGRVLIDLTQDNVVADKLAAGYTAHGADGEQIVGTNTFDVDSSDITTKPAEVLAGKPFAAGGQVKTGTMPNRGGVQLYLTKADEPVPIPQGYHDGAGYVTLPAEELAKAKPENIREGITFIGIPGAMSGTEGAKPQAKEVTPTFEDQEVLPGEGYNYISSVLVKAIKVTTTDNSAGGTTVTIG